MGISTGYSRVPSATVLRSTMRFEPIARGGYSHGTSCYPYRFGDIYIHIYIYTYIYILYHIYMYYSYGSITKKKLQVIYPIYPLGSLELHPQVATYRVRLVTWEQEISGFIPSFRTCFCCYVTILLLQDAWFHSRWPDDSRMLLDGLIYEVLNVYCVYLHRY